MTVQPASQCHGLYASSDLWCLMEGGVLGARRGAVNLHGADVFQGPEVKDLAVPTSALRGMALVGWWLPSLEPSGQGDSQATQLCPTSASGAGGQCWAWVPSHVNWALEVCLRGRVALRELEAPAL